jgi:hypothetical protein
MWSIWNAPSDLDYYGQSGFGDDEPDEEPELEEPPEDYTEPLEAGPEIELEPPDDWPEPPDEGAEPPAEDDKEKLI